jgi:hypothetical protein
MRAGKAVRDDPSRLACRLATGRHLLVSLAVLRAQLAQLQHILKEVE